MRKVLQILKENNLYLKPKKCEFEKEEINYLGVIIGADHIKVNPIKVVAIQDWPTPRQLVEVQEFMGFLNFYRRFLKNLSKTAQPLYELTKRRFPSNGPWNVTMHSKP